MGKMKELFMQYQEQFKDNDDFIDDEYYKSTYHPTKEEEEAAFKLFNNQK